MTLAPLLAALAFAAIALQPQPPTTRVVLLPDDDGKTGAVLVAAAGGETLINQAFVEADVSTQGAVSVVQSDAERVRERFGTTLAARPQPPMSYTVYFQSGGNQLTPESAPVLNQLKAELARRAAPEITVIGHTDRVGALEQNDVLSRSRAEAVRDLLVAAGIEARLIETTGRGEREPLVPTADEVAEPKNRRVEISVR